LLTGFHFTVKESGDEASSGGDNMEDGSGSDDGAATNKTKKKTKKKKTKSKAKGNPLLAQLESKEHDGEALII